MIQKIFVIHTTLQFDSDQSFFFCQLDLVYPTPKLKSKQCSNYKQFKVLSSGSSDMISIIKLKFPYKWSMKILIVKKTFYCSHLLCIKLITITSIANLSMIFKVSNARSNFQNSLALPFRFLIAHITSKSA